MLCFFVVIVACAIGASANAAPVAPTPPSAAITKDPFKNVFDNGEKIVKNGTQYSQKMLFGLAGLGATATGAMAFFGRFRWNRFFILVGALLMMASAQYGVEYITGKKDAFETPENQNQTYTFVTPP